MGVYFSSYPLAISWLVAGLWDMDTLILVVPAVTNSFSTAPVASNADFSGHFKSTVISILLKTYTKNIY